METSEEREAQFTQELQDLFNKHKASIEWEQDKYGSEKMFICLKTEWRGDELVKDFCWFPLYKHFQHD